jgi:hypothetical protein
MKALVIKPTQISNFFANLRDKNIEIAGCREASPTNQSGTITGLCARFFNFGKVQILKESPISCVYHAKAKKKQIRPLYDTELPKVLNALRTNR